MEENADREPRTKRVNLTLTKSEWIALRKYAAQKKLHRNEVMRKFYEPQLKQVVDGKDPLA